MSAQHPPTFKVGLVQMQPKVNDPEHNFAQASNYIREAAEQGAALAVLPEYHLTGWAPTTPEFATIAQKSASFIPRYQKLAAELKISIIAGTIVQTLESDPPTTNGHDTSPTLHNIAPFISYTGELLGTYTKQNLWHPERPHLTPGIKRTPTASSLEPTGDDAGPSKSDGASKSDGPSDGPSDAEPPPDPHSIIETPLGPLGILICWDLAFPEAFRSLVRQGARIIVVPTFWMATDLSDEGLKLNPKAEALFLESTLVTRAFENTCCIIFVNAGGPASEGFCGLSQVAMPILGKLPGSFGGSEVGVKVVEVDMGVCDVAERNYKVREDLAREDWHYGYTHEVKG